jgi:hypothetical protein
MQLCDGASLLHGGNLAFRPLRRNIRAMTRRM